MRNKYIKISTFMNGILLLTILGLFSIALGEKTIAGELKFYIPSESSSITSEIRWSTYEIYKNDICYDCYLNFDINEERIIEGKTHLEFIKNTKQVLDDLFSTKPIYKITWNDNPQSESISPINPSPACTLNYINYYIVSLEDIKRAISSHNDYEDIDIDIEVQNNSLFFNVSNFVHYDPGSTRISCSCCYDLHQLHKILYRPMVSGGLYPIQLSLMDMYRIKYGWRFGGIYYTYSKSYKENTSTMPTIKVYNFSISEKGFNGIATLNIKNLSIVTDEGYEIYIAYYPNWQKYVEPLNDEASELVNYFESGKFLKK